jgi:hypothetical protein
MCESVELKKYNLKEVPEQKIKTTESNTYKTSQTTSSTYEVSSLCSTTITLFLLKYFNVQISSMPIYHLHCIRFDFAFSSSTQ